MKFLASIRKEDLHSFLHTNIVLYYFITIKMWEQTSMILQKNKEPHLGVIEYYFNARKILSHNYSSIKEGSFQIVITNQ